MANETYFRLQAGKAEPDQIFDKDLIPSSDEKDALVGTSGSASSANKYVTNADSRLPTAAETAALGAASPALTATNPVASEDFVTQKINGLDWQESVKHNINYVKTDTGAPTGTPTAGEKLLNTADADLYQESGGSWDAGTAVVAKDRFIFKDDGTGTLGTDANTSLTADNKIREYDGTVFTEITPDDQFTIVAEDEGTDGKRYTFKAGTSDWVQSGGDVDHNSLGGIQGGQAGERYHLTQNQHDAAANASSPSSSNPYITSSGRASVPVRMSFSYRGGFAAGQSNIEVYEVSGSTQRIPTHSAGSLVAVVAKSESAVTAGTLDVEPTINGTKVTPTSLDVQLNTTDTIKVAKSVSPDTAGLIFAQLDELGFKLTSDGTWANGSADILVDLYLVLDI